MALMLEDILHNNNPRMKYYLKILERNRDINACEYARIHQELFINEVDKLKEECVPILKPLLNAFKKRQERRLKLIIQTKDRINYVLSN